MRLLFFLLLACVALHADTLRLLNTPGHVLMLRHALAPGYGDPAHFDLRDCTSQRNLDETGREQARQIGNTIRKAGVKRAQVYSSQWCRCLETARLLGFGEVNELTGLNSFFQKQESRAKNLGKLRTFLESRTRDGNLIILVTHYVTIAAMTDRTVGSGEGVVLKLLENGDYEIKGEVQF